MLTFSNALTASKSHKSRAYALLVPESGPATLLIRQGARSESYDVREVLGTGFDGRCWELIKSDGESYTVWLARNGQDHQCGCKGHGYTGKCKHVDAIRDLLHAGHLDEPLGAAPQWPHPEQIENPLA